LRNFLTFVAIALVTALTVALVAPPFIDWSARREMVARAVAGRIGEPVRIGGEITLRLLPVPYLDVADVAIGPIASPDIAAPEMRVEFGIGALFGGRIRLEELSFEHPSLRLGPQFAAPAEGPLEFGKVIVHHGELRVERDGAAPILLHDLNFEGAARSVRGPWRAEGDFANGDARVRFQAATEAISGDAVPLKLTADSGTARADLDGSVTLGSTPAYAGAVALSGALDAPPGGSWPWRIAGQAQTLGDTVRVENADLRLGEDARALQATGALSLLLGERPALNADLKAKTLNLDSLLRSKDEVSAPPSRAFDAVAALVARAPGLSGLSLRLESGAAFLGARALDAPKLSLDASPDGALRIKLATGLPGEGRFVLDGAVEPGPVPVFRGHADGKLGAFAPLAAWVAEGDPALSERLASLGAALPEGDVAASGDVEVSREGASVRGLSLGFGATRFTGGGVYTLPAADKPGRLFLDLAADTLNIAQAPNVEAGLAWLGSNDLDFRLKAGALSVERVGLASAKGGAMTVLARKEGPKFSLQKLAIADLGGASFNVEGETSPSGRWARLTLDAGKLGDLATLVARAAPGPVARWFVQHADALSPAKATFEARRDGPPLPGPFPLDFLKADGAMAGARFGMTFSRAPAPVDAISAQASLDAPDAGGLLRKIGVAVPGGPPGRAEISLGGTGLWEHGFEGKARLALAGTVLTLTGALRPDGEGATLTGPLALKSADVFPALASLGFAASGLGVSAPADLTADLALDAKGAKLARLTGTTAGARLGGEIAVATSASLEPLATPAPATITGRLDLDRANAGGLVAWLLGKPGPLRPAAVWPETKFGAALLTPPATDLALKIDALDLGFGVGHSATTRLRLDRDRLAFDDLALTLNGGKVGGRLELRRDRVQATASGAFNWQGVAVERPVVRGHFDGSLDFAAVGETTAGLLANLTGTGRVKILDATIPRLDPDGFARALARIEQAAGAPPDGRKLEAQIAAELDRAPMPLADVEGALSLNSGALRFGPFAASARDGSARVAGSLGLLDLSLGLEANITDTKVGPFWSGAAPGVTATAKSALDAQPGPRRIEATLLSAGLAAEAVARESDRIANFEADMRERAMFNRKYKADRFLARRNAEIEAFEEEQERRRLIDEYRAAYDTWAASRNDSTP
jgi:uncharacterized protein involved in outer membrane biogenesis